MSKPKITTFLKDFVIVNAILFGAYLVITTVVTMFFGEAVLEFGTAPTTGEKPNIVLTIFYTLLQLAVFFGFYVLSLFRFEKESEEKRVFLAEIGAERFDVAEFSRKYYNERGKYMMIYFSTIVVIVSLARLIGIPLVSMLILPQSMLPTVLLSVFGIDSGSRSILLFIVTVIVNIALYFVYQRYICAKVYEKWADGRLRVK
ncbi:MAG: hypothetical protein IJY97_13760 [Clostridia bacterium]|nr:hypothetical protein [Clostridia bacterium]